MLLDLVMTFLVAGFLLFLVNRVIPMPPLARKVVTAILLFAVVAFLLGLVGVHV